MRIDPVSQAARFGYGSDAGAIAGADLRPALLAELAAGDPAPAAPVASSADGLAALAALRTARRSRGGAADPDPASDLGAARATIRAIAASDRSDTLSRALAAPIGFRERLVTFWTNHFTVSIRKPECRALAGSFRREAIAPNVTGRFSDMLLAVMRHPAMLHYLDNDGSVGPDSRAGLRSGRGLNENLARECLELHTLGADGGYDQADVTAFATLLTGWSTQTREPPFGFRFKPGAHQPGAVAMLGTTFPEGEEGGVLALAALAAHPATHRHLAIKLVRHFGADLPDPAEVRSIEGVLRDTDGDLGATSAALLGLRSAHRPQMKFRAPHDFVLAALRTLGPDAAPVPDAAAMLDTLAQPMFGAPLPNGWPDTQADWLGPEAMLRRCDAAWALSARAGAELDPGALARSAIGGSLRFETAHAIDHAGSRREAVALLLASPDFQRR